GGAGRGRALPRHRTAFPERGATVPHWRRPGVPGDRHDGTRSATVSPAARPAEQAAGAQAAPRVDTAGPQPRTLQTAALPRPPCPDRRPGHGRIAAGAGCAPVLAGYAFAQTVEVMPPVNSRKDAPARSAARYPVALLATARCAPCHCAKDGPPGAIRIAGARRRHGSPLGSMDIAPGDAQNRMSLATRTKSARKCSVLLTTSTRHCVGSMPTNRNIAWSANCAL